jgi:beta-phosphoglucomutase-like phosphatase (HAD superfamily)
MAVGGIPILPGVLPAMETVNLALLAACSQIRCPSQVSKAETSHPIWAICTSATRSYASSALKAAGIPIPEVFVAAEDVKRGKPL